jgi:2-iminobutanoate/2-iminopropanoate deaminase
MKKEVNSEDAPKAIGPYSQAIISNNLIFLSGQIALDPQTQKLVGLNITEQTTIVMGNIEAVLKEAGLTRHDILRMEIYLENIDDFPIVNEVYGKFFEEVRPKPTRITIQAAALPKGAKVEISGIARLK